MRKLAVLGAGGHGKVVADLALVSGWDQVDFYDDSWPLSATNRSVFVFGNTATILSNVESYDGVVVAVGDNRTRLRKLHQLLDAGSPVPFLVHPKAYVASDVVLYPGTVVFAGGIIQPGCSLGTGCIVNSAASIDHDCVLQAGVHVCPGAHLAGGITVDEYSLIGIGASVNQNLRVGRNVVVGAGAVVIDNIDNDLTVVGNPACKISKKIG